MLNHFGFVVLLTLGIVSVLALKPDRSGQNVLVEQVNAVGEVADFKINVRIEQFCCDGDLCVEKNPEEKCQGHLQVVLKSEKSLNSTTGDLSMNVSEDSTMVISKSNDVHLLRSIHNILAKQYFELASDSINVLKEPREVRVEIAKQINPVRYRENPEDEVLEKEGMGTERIQLPTYSRAPPMDIVKPIGFTLEEVEIIRIEALRKTNYYRSMFGIRDVVLENNLSQYSQNRANELALKANHLSINSKLEYWKSDIYGENLFTSYPVMYVGEVAVDFCFYEVADVNLDRDCTDYYVHHNEKTRRLNQLLWVKTQDIGVGASIGTDGKYYVVISFNPRGNIGCFMLENVPKFTKDLLKEAKNIVNRIDLKRSELLNHLNIKVPILPGWQTMLYDSNLIPNETRNKSESKILN